MRSNLRRYLRIAPVQRRLLWEALSALLVARVAMACLPFRRIAAWLGTAGAQDPAAFTPQQIHTAQAIGWAVSALGRRVPWDARCLAQALAATAMLRRRHLEGTVSFGVCAGQAAGFDAHAWVSVGAAVITGGPQHHRFTTLATFARRVS